MDTSEFNPSIVPEKCIAWYKLDRIGRDGYIHVAWEILPCDRGFRILDNGEPCCNKIVQSKLDAGEDPGIPTKGIVSLGSPWCHACQAPLNLWQDFYKYLTVGAHTWELMATLERWDSTPTYKNIRKLLIFPQEELSTMDISWPAFESQFKNRSGVNRRFFSVDRKWLENAPERARKNREAKQSAGPSSAP